MHSFFLKKTWMLVSLINKEINNILNKKLKKDYEMDSEW